VVASGIAAILHLDLGLGENITDLGQQLRYGERTSVTHIIIMIWRGPPQF